MNNNKYMELQRKLGSFYFNKVQPKITMYNKIRRENAINAILLSASTISLTCLAFAYWIPKLNIIIGCIFIILLLTLAIRNKSKKCINTDIEHDIKYSLMDDFVKIFGDFRWYNGKIYQDIDKLKALNLFNILSLQFDDCIEGTYQNVPIAIKEVKITPPIFKAMVCLPILLFLGPFSIIFIIIGLILLLMGTTSIINSYNNFISTLIKFGSSKVLAAVIAATVFVIAIKFIINLISKFLHRISTSFRGIIVEFAMNKDFEGHTFILDNTKDGNAIVVDKTKYSEVKLEDVEFARNYTVWTNNQIEARYLLTTAFIERLKNLKTSFKAQYTRVSFKDNKIVIALHTGRDMFKMADMFAETGKETFIELFNEISSVIDFIEQLKLNKKLGL